MGYLLDTHVLLWYFEDSPKLPKRIMHILQDDYALKAISSTSLWEIAIKVNLDKLELQFTFEQLLFDLKRSNITILQIKDEYMQGLFDLPYIHKDPFDRLLVSTAITDGLTLITADENIQKYDVDWIW